MWVLLDVGRKIDTLIKDIKAATYKEYKGSGTLIRDIKYKGSDTLIRDKSTM